MDVFVSQVGSSYEVHVAVSYIRATYRLQLYLLI
jgi:hypothetical protein